MHATIVMMIALVGLGCQNPEGDAPAIPAIAGQSVAASGGSVAADALTPPSYATYYGGGFASMDLAEDESFGACVRDTICSFIIGRSPDVPSARQIEAAYRAGYYSR
jgi:hypothetical protein